MGRALAIQEKALGLEDPGVATVLDNLAVLHDEEGKYLEAESLYWRAVRIHGKTLGPEHPRLATDLSNLASLYEEEGKYGEAQPLYQRALRIDEKGLGSEHPHVGTDLNNLATLYEAQGKYAEAEPRQVEVLTGLGCASTFDFLECWSRTRRGREILRFVSGTFLSI